MISDENVASTTSSAWAIIRQRNKVLVIEDLANQGSLRFPGGMCIQDELPEEAVLREVKAKAGLEIQKPKLVGLMSAKTIKADSKHIDYRFYFLIRKFIGEIALQSNDVTQAFWVSIKDILENDMVQGLRVPDFYKAMFQGIFHDGKNRVDLSKTGMACEGYMNFFPI